MDYSSILAYKTLFFANRAKGTNQQLNDGQKYTGIANGARCAITASQTIVPLVAVTGCLAKTAKNPTVASVAGNIANSNLKNIASAVTSDKTVKALDGLTKTVKFLSKLGIAGNIAYATAKCMDANEEDKTKVFMKAAGNCAGMYLFEHIYSKIVDKITAEDIKRTSNAMSNLVKKLPILQKIKITSVLTGIGFVIASLYGCKIGELCGEALVKDKNVNNNNNNFSANA